jgi:hypothetical protein
MKIYDCGESSAERAGIAYPIVVLGEIYPSRVPTER